MTSKNLLKTLGNYVGIYITGVTISAGFVLYCNDMFYLSVFKRISPITGQKTNLLQEIKPREIYGNNAKQTFLEHHIEEDMNDDSRIYHNYVQSRKNIDSSNNSLYNNIYDKKVN